MLNHGSSTRIYNMINECPSWHVEKATPFLEERDTCQEYNMGVTNLPLLSSSKLIRDQHIHHVNMTRNNLLSTETALHLNINLF
jgi:hypothetical protein